MQSEDIQKNPVIKMYISTQFNIKRIKKSLWQTMINKLVITELSIALQETAHWLALQRLQKNLNFGRHEINFP